MVLPLKDPGNHVKWDADEEGGEQLWSNSQIQKSHPIAKDTRLQQ